MFVVFSEKDKSLNGKDEDFTCRFFVIEFSSNSWIELAIDWRLLVFICDDPGLLGWAEKIFCLFGFIYGIINTNMIFSLFFILYAEGRPDGFIVQPLPRDEMSSLTISPPCGGIPKGKSHFLSQPGSLNPITWQIIVPSSGNCSLKLMYGNDYSEQHILIPTDNSTDPTGFFPCGSSEGVFSKIFKFPNEVSCDSCTLQWVWENNVDTYYQCSDIEVLEDIDAACYGKCQNDGYCSGGLCVCKKYFVGTFCEIDSTADRINILALFVTFLVLFSVASCLMMSLFWRMKLSKPSFTEKRCFEMCCFWLPFNWNQWHQKNEVLK